MKVNTSIKKVVDIELTLDDVKSSLKNYQLDLLHDLATILKADNAFDQYEMFWNLMQGEHSRWWSDITDKHNIYWIYTPEVEGEWINLIEEFPHIFIHNAVNVFEDVKADALNITFTDSNNITHKINSRCIIDNL
jgi:hypothetical protein